MKAWAKLIARISVLCYLTVSGVALAHSVRGIAMFDLTAQSSMSSPAAKGLSPTPTMNDSIATMQDQASAKGDCHQSAKAMADRTCQIVCMALSVALTSELSVACAQLIPALHFYRLAEGAVTQLNNVEPHPPKSISSKSSFFR